MINFFKKKENKINNYPKLKLSDKFPWISNLDKNFIKDLPIKEFKRILYTQYSEKPVKIATSYFEIAIEELSEMETSSSFEPKTIKVKNKDIELTILLH